MAQFLFSLFGFLRNPVYKYFSGCLKANPVFVRVHTSKASWVVRFAVQVLWGGNGRMCNFLCDSGRALLWGAALILRSFAVCMSKGFNVSGLMLSF